MGADISIVDGKIAGISSATIGVTAATARTSNTGHTLTTADMGGAIVMPCFVDMHAHLDKGHILPRTSIPDGTFAGALQLVFEDHNHWHADGI